jgi:hypothetical protein
MMQSGFLRAAPRSLATAAGALVLAGCAATEPPPACPEASALRDAARLVAFTGEGKDLTDKRFEVRIVDVALACDVDREDDGQTVLAEMKVLFQAEKGPANEADAAPFGYFVAITDADRNVLQRKTFETAIPLQGNTTRGATVETLSPTLPLPPEANPASYRVIVGLELSRDQLRHNRENPL